LFAQYGRRAGLIATLVLLFAASPASAEPPRPPPVSTPLVPPRASPRPPAAEPAGSLARPRESPSRLRFGSAAPGQANFSGTVTIPKTTRRLVGPQLRPQTIVIGSPVAGARVVFPGRGLGATTDAAGRFEVNIPISGEREFVSYSVESLGFGVWTRVGERLEAGQSYHVEVFLERDPVTTKWQPPLSEMPGALPKKAVTAPTGDGGRLASRLYNQPLYSDTALAPPTIRVAFVPAGTKNSACNYTGSYPPAYTRVQTYSMDYYLRQVTQREYGTSTYPDEAVKAVATAVKNYAWYWINQGGKSYTPDADADDAANNYQCFDPGLAITMKVDQAVANTLGVAMSKDPDPVVQAQYYAGTNSCNDSDGNHLDQLGAAAWAAQACGTKTYDWILHHYYDTVGPPAVPMVLFNTAAAAQPFVTSKRRDEGIVELHFEAPKGVWAYQIQRYDPATGQWSLMFYPTRDSQTGEIPTEWIDELAAPGVAYDYVVWSRGSYLWSAGTYITVKAWTTDLWNASFEHAYFDGNRAYYWLGNNAPSTSVVSPGWDGDYRLRFSPQPGNWASVYQDVFASQSLVCPIGVVRRPQGYGDATVTLTVWGLGGPGADEQFSQAWLVPGNNLDYWLALDNPRQCHTFSQGHSFIRVEVYNSSNGPIDLDYMRLVYNADTYNRY